VILTLPWPDAEPAEVAAQASAFLAEQPVQEIIEAQQLLWELMSDSYRQPVWAAAYVINGGCSDDGFEYFRGWLITQGREVFDRVVADPDALSDLPAFRGRRRWRHGIGV
jgi:hypothetical protein